MLLKNDYNISMNEKKDISKVINSKTTYKIDDYYDPVRVTQVINKVNNTNLNPSEFSFLNLESSRIEIRAKKNSTKYFGTSIIHYKENTHRAHIIVLLTFVELLLFSLIVLPCISLAVENLLIMWTSLGLCGLWLVGIILSFIFWPRSTTNKNKMH